MGAEFVHGLFGSRPRRQPITAVVPIDRIWRVKTRMFTSSIIAITYTPPATRHHPFHTLNKMAAVDRRRRDVHLPSLACRPIRLVSFHPPAGASASKSGWSQVTKHQTPPNRKPARCGKGLSLSWDSAPCAGDGPHRTNPRLGFVVETALPPHEGATARWWPWAGRRDGGRLTTCGRISDECSWLDVSWARVMPVKPLGESPSSLGDEVAKRRRRPSW